MRCDAVVRRALAAAACLLAVGGQPAGPARATSAGEIRAEGRRLDGEWQQMQRAGTPGAAAEQRLIEQLGPLVLAFIDRCDAAARSGSESARRDELRGAFEALSAPLDGIYRARSGRLERMARTVMDEDGDLEALYETPDFRESQAVAAQSLYYLNWLNYYGARLYDGARRTALLEAAERGFSEFAVGDRRDELLTESLLGRGLCHLELGDAELAVRDFSLVIDEPTASPERKAKARLALLDAYARGGKVADALRYSDELLRSGALPGADAPLVRFYRLQALFDAQEKAKGADAERYRREASAVMEQLRRAGPGWADKVDALMVSRIKDPSEWAGRPQTPRVQWELARLMLEKNDYAGAAPLLEQVAASEDADVKDVRAEASYWLGVARFKAGDYPAAAAAFDAALAGAPAAYFAEARYLRFKSLEAMMATQEAPELRPRYRGALEELIAEHADHPNLAEARYRLAEYRQATGEFAAAIDEYAKVTGDPGLELRARFGSVQSRFELLKSEPDPKARQALLDGIGQDLDRFRQQFAALEAKRKDSDDASLREIAAKAALLEAVYLTLKGDGGDHRVAAMLADFGERFPGQPDLLPQAVRLRLGALLQTGQFAAAEQELARHGAALERERRIESLEGLATGYAKAGARRKAEGDAAAGEAAARAALGLYGIIAAAEGTADAKQQLTVARLHETTGDWAAAAAIYRQLLQANGNSLVALRGLARAAEAQGDLTQALAHWVDYTARAHPGDLGWFQGQYQQARVALAAGDAARSCELLTNLRPAMPGLTDAELKAELTDLYQRACR